MSQSNEPAIFIGLEGLRLDDEQVDLGEGARLIKCAARFVTPFMLDTTGAAGLVDGRPRFALLRSQLVYGSLCSRTRRSAAITDATIGDFGDSERE